MAWIEVHQSLIDHRKTLQVAEELRILPIQVVGHLVALWLWALDSAQDGDLRVTDRVIAKAARWAKRPEPFMAALLGAGFIEYSEAGYLRIHDWNQYAGRLMDRRRANAERAKRSRQSHSPEPIPQRDVRAACAQRARDGEEDVRAPCGATVPYRTVPNPTSSTNVEEVGGANTAPSSPRVVSHRPKGGRVTPAVIRDKQKLFPDLDVEAEAEGCVTYWGHPDRGEDQREAGKTDLQRWLEKSMRMKAEGKGKRESKVSEPPPPVYRKSVNPTPAEVEIWTKALENIKGRVSQTNMETYFAGTVLVDLKGGAAVVVAPDHRAREWLEQRMTSTIAMALGGILDRQVQLKFEAREAQ